MPTHLYVCTANGKVKTEEGLVPFTEHLDKLAKQGVTPEQITGMTVLNPLHHDCHLICAEPKKCRGLLTT